MSYPESFNRPIPLDKALEICRRSVKPINRTESIPIESALGRVLAEDVKASINVPPFARSAMDGFAVRSVDFSGSRDGGRVELRIVQRIFAGMSSESSIGRLECAAVATGGMIPDGADAVVMIEDTEAQTKGRVVIVHPPRKGDHVIKPGDDIKKGSIVASKGEMLLPAKIGATSAIGRGSVLVYQRPKIVIMPTGDEVIPPGERLKPGQIYDVNTYTLLSAIESFGAQPSTRPIVKDTLESISRALDAAKDADMIIFSGGSSVGEKDLIASAVAKSGKILFHGVAIKPGKPTLLGKVGRTAVLGMPGHPASCLSNAYLFLEPMVRIIGRLPASSRKEISLRLVEDVRLPKGRTLILPVKIEGENVVPAFKESSAITSMANADGFVVLDSDSEGASKGTMVLVKMY